MFRALWRRFAAPLTLVALAAPLSAQERPVTWTLLPSAAAQQGSLFTLTVQATIDAGWHVYSLTQDPDVGPIPMRISLPGGQAFRLADEVVGPEPLRELDPNFGDTTETYTVAASFPVAVLPLEAGQHELVVAVRFQVCNDRVCLPPRTESLTLAMAVASGPAVPAAMLAALPPLLEDDLPPTAGPPPPASGIIRGPGAAGAASTDSLLLFLGMAALWGAISLLTPCVFPMVPITVSYFTQRGAVPRGTALRQAAIYAAGIMATFTLLGLAIAALFGAGGVNRFAANPWINLLITGIFVVFALNLFGLFQLQVSPALLTRLEGAVSRGDRGGTAGSLLMGLTFTLTSFTCTVPLVGTLLVAAAQGDWTWPLLGMLTYSAVFAFPFFLLALVPNAMHHLPRSGAWLGVVKPILGCLELAMAFKFLSNADLVLGWGIFTRQVVLAAWLLAALVIVALLLDLMPRLRRRPAAPLSVTRLTLSTLTLWLAVVLGRGITGARVGELESFLPPREGRVVAGVTAVDGEPSWLVNDYQAARTLAQDEGRPILIDFTGYTCTNCRWMEANMFPREAIVEELEHFVRVRLYTDGVGEPYLSQQRFELETFQTVALPLYAVVDAAGQIYGQFLGMTRDQNEFASFLRMSRLAAGATAP